MRQDHSALAFEHQAILEFLFAAASLLVEDVVQFMTSMSEFEPCARPSSLIAAKPFVCLLLELLQSPSVVDKCRDSTSSDLGVSRTIVWSP